MRDVVSLAFHQWLWLAFISRAVEVPVEFLLQNSKAPITHRISLVVILSESYPLLWIVCLVVAWLSAWGLPILLLAVAGWKVALVWYAMKFAGSMVAMLVASALAAARFPNSAPNDYSPFTMLVVNPAVLVTCGLLSLLLLK
jgi:hypothetical protein